MDDSTLTWNKIPQLQDLQGVEGWGLQVRLHPLPLTTLHHPQPKHLWPLLQALDLLFLPLDLYNHPFLVSLLRMQQ